jgi:predicted membrane channel-forming protein YqfA (hemolysin III family)
VNPYQNLLWSLVVLLLASAFLNQQQLIGRIVWLPLFLTALLAILRTTELSPRFKLVFRGVAILIFVFGLSTSTSPEPVRVPSQLLNSLLGLIFLFLSIQGVLKKLFRESRVTGDTLRGGISVYLMLGWFWVFIYQIIYLLEPGAFSRPLTNSQLIYFSFTTLTTVGYGDILPVNQLAMIFSNLEAVVGQMYPAIIIARLVSLYESHDGKP